MNKLGPRLGLIRFLMYRSYLRCNTLVMPFPQGNDEVTLLCLELSPNDD